MKEMSKITYIQNVSEDMNGLLAGSGVKTFIFRQTLTDAGEVSIMTLYCDFTDIYHTDEVIVQSMEEAARKIITTHMKDLGPVAGYYQCHQDPEWTPDRWSGSDFSAVFVGSSPVEGVKFQHLYAIKANGSRTLDCVLRYRSNA